MRRAVSTVVLKRAGRERASGERERESGEREKNTSTSERRGDPPPLPRKSQSTYVTASLLADIATSLAGTSPPPPENAIQR